MKKLVKNKKGAEMTIGTIIIIVLALVVLVVLVIGFTGGWTNLWDKIKSFFGGGENASTRITACKTACMTDLSIDYCKTIDVKFEDKDQSGTYNCKGLEKVQGSGLSCDKNFDCGIITPCKVVAGMDCDKIEGCDKIPGCTTKTGDGATGCTGTRTDCAQKTTKTSCDAMGAVCKWS